MRTFLDAVKDAPHAEERPKSASRSTLGADAGLIDALPPEFARGEARALSEARKLCPDHTGIDGGLADPGAVATVASSNDVVAAHEPRIAADALGDQLWVLDKVGLRFDHAGDQYFA